jgi:GNAT superfamily N-acetyltransferase
MDLVEICARGEAAWQRVAHEGLGKSWSEEGGVAWAPLGAGHPFLLSGVTLDRRATPPVGMPGTLCDSYRSLNGLSGYECAPADPWMVRPPGPLALVPKVSGLRISRVQSDSDTSIFERTAFIAAGGQPPGRPGELHPPGSQHVPGLHLLIAWMDGAPSGTALAVEHGHGLVISGVTVLPAVRGRGIGAALVAATLRLAPHQPASLAASAQGLGLYVRLGFQQVTQPSHWRRLEEQR